MNIRCPNNLLGNTCNEIDKHGYVKERKPLLYGPCGTPPWETRFHQTELTGNLSPEYSFHIPVPSGYLTVRHGKSNFLMGKLSINGPFSMAMLNNQRVNQRHLGFADPELRTSPNQGTKPGWSGYPATSGCKASCFQLKKKHIRIPMTPWNICLNMCKCLQRMTPASSGWHLPPKT